MFDQIPIRAWLLLAIVIAAYAPLQYVFKHVTRGPSRRDITQAPEDLTWRTSGQFARNLALLVGLAALAVFIFTPEAARFAQSPSFLPILASAGGVWVAKAYSSGSVEPIVQGVRWTFERGSQPKRFWASMAWNALFGCLCLFLAFKIDEEAPMQALRDQCYNRKDNSPPQKRILACNDLLAEHGDDDGDRSGLIAARGSAYYMLRNYQRAMIEYSTAIRLDPKDSSSHYNLGLVHEQLGERLRAVDEYGEAIRIDPKNAGAYARRGLILLDTNRLDRAISDFTRAHELEPGNSVPLANRGIAYAWKNDRQRAEQDFQSVRASDPSKIVVLRGQALLAMNNGDTTSAVRYLTSAIDRDPNDAWSLSMRAEAYKRQGEYGKMQADADAVRRSENVVVRDGRP
jgi:tetratricopeptide (TPR) repeat protein